MDTQCIELVGQGEPTLHHKVTEMLQYAKSKDMVVRMVSNGSRIFKDLAEAMVNTGMEHLQISMNAGKPETYPKIHVTESPENYLKVKENLKYLYDYKKKRKSKFPYVRLSFVISKDNCFELKEMVQATHDVGAEEATFVYASVHEGTQNIKLTEEEFRKVKASIPEAMELAKKLPPLNLPIWKKRSWGRPWFPVISAGISPG
jgi:MoaA/NifB/PqqE/SkfB family radical SAM enzyme